MTKPEVNFDGLSLLVACFSFLVAVVSIAISINGYKLSKRAFDTEVRRLAREGAGRHVLDILELMSISKPIKDVSDEVWNKKSKAQKNIYIKKFERKYDKLFTELNISCSAFTNTRSLSEEHYAYINIGLLFCDFIKPHYELLIIINDEKYKYNDILTLYRLWITRRELLIYRKFFVSQDKSDLIMIREITKVFILNFIFSIRCIYRVTFKKSEKTKKELNDLLY